MHLGVEISECRERGFLLRQLLVDFRSALTEAVQSLEPFVPPRLDGAQFLVTLPLLINFPAVALAAFECLGEIKGWGDNLKERTALDLDFECECRGLSFQSWDLLAGFDGAANLRAGGVGSLAPAGHYRQLFTLHPQPLELGYVVPQLAMESLHSALGFMVGGFEPLNLPDLPMEVFDASRKFRASFRQIGEVLLSRQQALIPPNLTLGFCDLHIRFAQLLIEGLNLGQDRLPTGLHCLELKQPLLCCTLLGLQGLKTG